MRRDTGIMKRGAALLLSLFMLSAAMCAAAENDTEKGETFMFENEIPAEYLTKVPDGGRIEEITYLSKDYYKDQADVEKHALVYVPAGYTGTVYASAKGDYYYTSAEFHSLVRHIHVVSDTRGLKQCDRCAALDRLG